MGNFSLSCLCAFCEFSPMYWYDICEQGNKEKSSVIAIFILIKFLLIFLFCFNNLGEIFFFYYSFKHQTFITF